MHLAIGTLLDLAGNDTYNSQSVSQGCGHDLSIGYLLDLAGNDNYIAYDLTQGVGNANGLGVLIDVKGEDTYTGRNTKRNQGYGNARREYGSIGLCLDLDGKDYYNSALSDNDIRLRSNWGIALDLPTVEIIKTDKPKTTKEPNRIKFIEKDYTIEEIFLMAISLEVKFKLWRDYAIDWLVTNPDSSLPYLRGHIGTKDSKEYHSLRHIFLRMDSLAIPFLIEALEDDSTRVVSQAAYFLGLVGDSSAAPSLINILSHPEISVRANASYGLGKIGSLSAKIPLRHTLKDTSPAVRREAAYALGLLKAAEAIEDLIILLSDSLYSVRYPAQKALIRIGIPAIPNLISALDTTNQIRSNCYIIEALGNIAEKIYNDTTNINTDVYISICDFLLEKLENTDNELEQDYICRALSPFNEDNKIKLILETYTIEEKRVRIKK